MTGPMPTFPQTVGRSSGSCAIGVAAQSAVAARLSAIGALRDGGWPESAPALPRRFLRHADEQTVLGMHAMLDAIRSLSDPRPPLDGHGVIAASCQAGRIAGAQTLVQAKEGGGINVSTHIVPQGSLHSLAAAVSVGLGMHGPNIGVGGGPEALAEGLLTAFSWLHATGRNACNTVWLVATGWDDEPSLDAAGEPITDPVCRGVALALARPAVAGTAASTRFTLHLDWHDDPATSPLASAVSPLHVLATAIAEHTPAAAMQPWSLRLPSGASVRLIDASASAATRTEAA